MKTITAYKCKACGLVMFPYHDRCLNCKAREYEEIEPSDSCKLITYTVIEQLPWGLDERGRVLGVVEFENGIKALGLLTVDEPRLGMKLSLGWAPVREFGGVKIYGLTLSKAS